jgi:DNA-binding CsgD family transcriptional regulator
MDVLALDAAERAAYELLVDLPSSTLDELAGRWDRTEPLEAALLRLEERGLVSCAAGPLPRYTAVAPGVAFEGLLLDLEEQLDAARRRLSALDRQYRAQRDATIVEVVSGRRAVEQRLGQVRRRARREICSLSPGSCLAPGPMEPLRPDLDCRTIYDRPSLSQPGILSAVRELALAGQQSRVLAHLPLRLHLADNQFALVQLTEPGHAESAMLIRPSALLDALGKLFEMLWQRALPLEPALDDAGPGRGRSANATQQHLVTLLLSGLTDEAIARHLGVSYRTVQRRVADLMAELGAHTRFQAGAQAALRGYPQAPR